MNRIQAGVAVRIKRLCATPEVQHRLRELGFCEDQVIKLLTSQTVAQWPTVTGAPLPCSATRPGTIVPPSRSKRYYFPRIRRSPHSLP